MPTVKDVARIAGVSTATVSRALSSPDKVTEATRKKVEQAAEQAGYAPNGMARSLRRNEAKTLVAVLPNLSNSFFTEIINGIEAFAHNRGYKLLVGDAGHDDSRAQGYFDLVSSKQADGVICLTSAIPPNLLLDAQGTPRFPLVMACEYYRDTVIPTVNIDNAYSARKAVEYLILMGHHKIATITGEHSNPLCQARLSGYQSALTHYKIKVPGYWVLEGEFTFNSGYNLGRQLLSSTDPPSAVFCQSDEMAIGLLRAAREMKVKVPENLSVIGFDNIEFAEYADPMLTTVHQPRRLIGETAVKLLLDILAGKKPNPEMTLPTQLIVRDSSCPPPMDQRLQRDL